MTSSLGPSSHSVSLSPIVLAAFSIREHIASGGIAEVYRGLSTSGSLVAIKVIPLQHDSGTERKKILREMRIHETLKHDNILELIGGEQREREGNWPEGLYIVLSLASGGDLFDKIGENGLRP